ncbi:uncharacterized protein LACBIDRAFT_335595 [Laccaria bicolor S238N-H82]|uniref:Predicted protein n=1 Tax=Laccaria bicolor (strain S238N-H82 / ATCC MYA-4686) TaxID=486041 RepID=B0E2T0_LACBS|nr:uncharacterized protein LACBIDRAFT_335595 [Laccaria bicolor S238N-H82]EDQ98844.1 predicted protein [Laccaria bicolor S238N-H82]|eukprot:XP_001890497.1 predicted protein [Laccaria bicolor S238N-H82]
MCSAKGNRSVTVYITSYDFFLAVVVNVGLYIPSTCYWGCSNYRRWGGFDSLGVFGGLTNRSAVYGWLWDGSSDKPLDSSMGSEVYVKVVKFQTPDVVTVCKGGNWKVSELREREGCEVW